MMRVLWLVVLLALVTACAPHHPKVESAHDKPPRIGPYDHFSARLIVMEPNHRWQVMMGWQGNAVRGTARLNHAASGRVLMIRWHHEKTEILDNQESPQQWRVITAAQLAERGMVVPPTYIAAILNNRIPPLLKYQGQNTWQGSGRWKGIRLNWQPERKLLIMRDLAHGREVRIMIQA